MEMSRLMGDQEKSGEEAAERELESKHSADIFCLQVKEKNLTRAGYSPLDHRLGMEAWKYASQFWSEKRAPPEGYKFNDPHEELPNVDFNNNLSFASSINKSAPYESGEEPASGSRLEKFKRNLFAAALKRRAMELGWSSEDGADAAPKRVRKPKPPKRVSPLGELEDGSLVPAWKRRTEYSDDQRATLLSIFKENPYPDREMKEEVMRRTGLDMQQVVNWFQNTRNKTKKALGSLDKDRIQRLTVSEFRF